MRKIMLVLQVVCPVFAVHGRRVSHLTVRSSSSSSAERIKPLESDHAILCLHACGAADQPTVLARLLCAFNQFIAFKGLDPGCPLHAGKTVLTSGCQMSSSRPRVPAISMAEVLPSEVLRPELENQLATSGAERSKPEAPSPIAAKDAEGLEIRDILARIVERDAVIAKKEKIIAEKEKIIADKDKMISEKDKIIATVLDAERDVLLEFLRPLHMGFNLRQSKQREVMERVDVFLNRFSTLPQAQEGRLQGSWRLLYTDAPGILGLGTGPLSQLSDLDSIIEKIDSLSGTCDYVIRYRPSNQLRSVFQGLGEEIGEDRLEQNVLFDLEENGSGEFPRRVAVKFKGTKVVPLRLLGGRITNDWAPALGGSGPLSLPFGSFDVLYNDGRLRIIRVVAGGYLSVTERVQGTS